MTEDKTCKTCIDNDNGFCDRKGILVEDDDHCSDHKSDWRESMMRNFPERTLIWGEQILDQLSQKKFWKNTYEKVIRRTVQQ